MTQTLCTAVVRIVALTPLSFGVSFVAVLSSVVPRAGVELTQFSNDYFFVTHSHSGPCH